MNRAFTDFYSDHGARLASRNYNLDLLFQAREALFLSLGLPPSLLKGCKILEFGPGTGHYSVFNFLQNPKNYIFVEGVEEARSVLKRRLDKYKKHNVDWSINDELFEDFETTELYDLVIAESCIPHQKNPDSIFRHFTKYVAPGGVILITTASGVSYLSETLRRLIRDKLISPMETAENQLKLLTPVFSTHLDNLRGVSRTAEEWILDAIIQPLGEVRLFSIAEAIEAVGRDFSVLGTAPDLIQDYAWYRTLRNPAEHSRKNSLSAYYKNVCSLLDVRYPGGYLDADAGTRLEASCNQLWNSMATFETEVGATWDSVFETLESIEKNLIEINSSSLSAFQEIVDWLCGESYDATKMKEFPHWWGVGQQHIAFYRNKHLIDS